MFAKIVILNNNHNSLLRKEGHLSWFYKHIIVYLCYDKEG